MSDGVPAAKGSVRAVSRRAIFLLSPRIVDFDTYLPVAMEIRRQRPGWDIRFVTFSRANANDILRNTTLVSGLARAGTLHCLDARSHGRLAWPFLRVLYMLYLLALIVSRPGPMLFLGRPFERFPYSLWYLLARLRGGRGVVLAKTRQTDDNIQIKMRDRLRKLPQNAPNWIERMLGRDHDLFVHYNDDQDTYAYGMGRAGRLDAKRTVNIGMPNFGDEWTALIRDETRKLRDGLSATGRDLREVYVFFPAKNFAARCMRSPESPDKTFRQLLTSLMRLRPNCLVLLRPHPIAARDPTFQRTLAEFNDPRIVVTFAHPEVLIAMSRRVLVNGSGNIQTTSPAGMFIDCTEYSDEHYAEFGEVSLADGYGSILVRPDQDGFDQRLASALEDDSLFADEKVDRKRRALREKAGFRIDALLARLESRAASTPQEARR